MNLFLLAVLAGVGTYFGTKVAKKIDASITTKAVDMPLDENLPADERQQIRFFLQNSIRPTEIDSGLFVLKFLSEKTGQQYPLANAALMKRKEELTL